MERNPRKGNRPPQESWKHWLGRHKVALGTSAAAAVGVTGAALFGNCEPQSQVKPTATVRAAESLGIPRPPTFLPVATEGRAILEASARKEKILSFSWKDAENDEKLRTFTQFLANEYVLLTNTPRVTASDLVTSTNFYKDTNSYSSAVRKFEPTFTPSATNWGYTDYNSGQVFLNLEKLRGQTQQADGKDADAGAALFNAAWHEWGHRDVKERREGKLLRNPTAFFFSPRSGKNEVFEHYRGGEIFTATYYGYKRFEEVLNEAVTIRRAVEQMGLEQVFSARDYYQNGIDFFPLFTSQIGISVDELYRMHAESDFEGLATRVGQHLPMTGEPMDKGIFLFTGIHRSDPQMIQQSGVYQVMGRQR